MNLAEAATTATSWPEAAVAVAGLIAFCFFIWCMTRR